MLFITKNGVMDDTTRRERPALGGLTAGVKARKRAFTLIELLVVIAIIAILAAMLLPVLQAAKLRGQTATCIANQSQFAKAWVMYTSDNNDFTPGNWWEDEKDWPAHPNENWISGWEDPTGSSPNPNVTVGDSDSTNITLLVSPGYSTIATYIGWQPGLYQCPSSIVLVKSFPASKLVRTVSMNAWVGYNTQGAGGATATNNYRIYTKTSVMTAGAGPSDLFVFIEERGESIDDGSFAIEPPGFTTLENMPMNAHNMAGTLGFADGHVEVHRWLGLGSGWAVSGSNPANANITTTQQALCAKWTDPIGTVAARDPGDLSWLEAHATSHK
jgi:prepilin-type N-terminal cleavage/methylation domain-containing protein